MAAALYTPEVGYYRRPQDPFGRAGDFYTAAQLQPVFGTLMSRVVGDLLRGIEGPAGVLEVGAGRGEMFPYFEDFGYTPIDFGFPNLLPAAFRGVIFLNEFFDALPVRIVVRRGARFVERLVGWIDGRFRFVDGPEAAGPLGAYLDRFAAEVEQGSVVEAHLEGIAWIDRLSAISSDADLLVIDYGYTAREFVRHARGTLMSYRAHTAMEDVLAEPGLRDITAHVPFGVLTAAAADRGWRKVRFETLTQLLMSAGEADQFAGVLELGDPDGARLQLKKLLVEMGEVFRCLLLRKRETQ